MQTKDIVQLLGIEENKIKDYIRSNVFSPENPSVNGSRINYTDRDIEKLKRLMVLRSAGLTVKDLQELQEFPEKLGNILLKRMENMTKIRKTKSEGLIFAEALLLQINNQEEISYDSFWNMIHLEQTDQVDYEKFLSNFKEAYLLKTLSKQSRDESKK
ncbi:MerR family transcriptional regulator [Ileibacterium valens]|uniref:MerR family transcriptional regulator n=1 Tax=Ileibacterium valens TaxID=1862668 RepID=UPI002572C3FE|nr:MerR family transcriptional regulator [Ileibacterium valens]